MQGYHNTILAVLCTCLLCLSGPVAADVENGRIAQVGRNLEVAADRVVDASERVLAPGFIDVHTHVETSERREGIAMIPRADNYLLDGVTTIVTGNCGGSEIDIDAWARDLEGLGINVATMIGHNSVRREVVGLDDRAPTDDELAQIPQTSPSNTVHTRSASPPGSCTCRAPMPIPGRSSSWLKSRPPTAAFTPVTSANRAPGSTSRSPRQSR